MRHAVLFAAFGLATGVYAVSAPLTHAQSPQAESCRQRAATDGKDDPGFYARCMTGAMAPPEIGRNAPGSLGEQAIVAPTGSSPAERSDQCSAEADRRGLTSGERDNFRRGCLASAAPVGNIGVAGQATVPTPEKSELGGLTAAPKGGPAAATTAGAQIAPK